MADTRSSRNQLVLILERLLEEAAETRRGREHERLERRGRLRVVEGGRKTAA